MVKTFDKHCEFDNYNAPQTYFRLQIYQDFDRAPVYVVSESPKNPGPPLEAIRADLAQELSRGMEVEPRHVQWFEQDANDQFMQYHFRELGPDRNAEVIGEGDDQRLKTQFTDYDAHAVDKEYVQGLVGKEHPLDPPLTHEEQQNREFAELRAPKEFERPEPPPLQPDESPTLKQHY